MKHPPMKPGMIETPHRCWSAGDLHLESGERVQAFELSYVTHGKLNEARDNAVLVTVSLTGNHHRLDFLIGPGRALDGKPRFDLTRFDPAFFGRLRSQIREANRRGLYVSILLFEVYGFMDRDGKYPNSLWAGNVFHGPNNINGIDVDTNGDRHGLEFFYTGDNRVLSIQRSYVRRMIDALGEFDNIFYVYISFHIVNLFDKSFSCI